MYQIGERTAGAYVQTLQKKVDYLRAAKAKPFDVEPHFKKIWSEMQSLVPYLKMISTFSKRYCGFVEYGFPSAIERSEWASYCNTTDEGYGFPFVDGVARRSAGVYIKVLMDKIEQRTALRFPVKWEDRKWLHEDLYFDVSNDFKYTYDKFLEESDIKDGETATILYDFMLKNSWEDDYVKTLEQVNKFTLDTMNEDDIDRMIIRVDNMISIFKRMNKIRAMSVTLTDDLAKELEEFIND